MSNYSAIDMTTAAAQGFRDGVESVANSAIPNNQDASAAQPAPVVPEGYAVVPVEPTPAMLDVAVSHALMVSLSGDYNWSAYMRDVWLRMVSAAAPAQGQQVECQECERLREEVAELDALLQKQSDLLSATAIAVRGPEPVLTRYSHADIPSRVKVVVDELSALKAQQAGQEPVAWLSPDGRSAYVEDDVSALPYNYRVTLRPLHLLHKPAPAQDVADVRKMARAISDRQADACNVDREDQWKLYSEDFVADVEAMLAALAAHDKQSGGEV